MAGLNEFALKFDTVDKPHFHVEFTDYGNDIVYHFWPPGDASSFIEGFAKHLEDGFKEVLPSDADVRASHTDLQEAQLRHREGVGAVPQKDIDRSIVVPRETYYVRVVEGLQNPMASMFLKGRVFEKIEAAINGAK